MSLTYAIILLLGSCVFGQDITVSGVVSDRDGGETLPGVNVVISDADMATGTITDFDGNYEITIQAGQTLMFSYIGYQPQNFTPTESGTLNVILAPASELLDEVVVLGYGAVGKKDLTGVVTKIGDEDFNRGVVTSPEALLTGKVAGLQINTNGEPGGEMKLRLRGGTSLNASSAPLIVIDGVPVDNRKNASGRNPLNFINASDIENMTILKDASATAIYGSRGANGVIIVTTKSGKSGKMKITYNGNYSISDFAGGPTVFDPETYRLAVSAKAPQELDNLGQANTDWVEEVTQAATGMQHNATFSGGLGDKTTYYLSLNHLTVEGVLKTSKSDKTNIALNLSTKLFNDRFIVNYRSKNGFTKDQYAPNVLGAALTFDPTQPIRDETSKFGGYFQWNDPLTVNNPVSTLDLTDDSGKAFRSLNNVDLEYKLPWVEGLSIKTNLSYDFTDGEKRTFRDPLLKDSETFDRMGYLFNEDEKLNSSLIETYGIYNRKLDHIRSNIELVAGHSWQETDRDNRWIFGNGLELVGSDYMRTTDIKRDSFIVKSRLISFFGRMNYNFDERYLLTLSYRRDGSSRFGPSNQWGNFVAAALGWRILQEDFASGLNNIFDDLKLRVSYGVTGNEDIKDFLFATFYGYGTDDARYQFGDEFVNTLRGTGVDPNIKWEETSSINFGLDFGFWKGRLTGSVDYYKKYTNDLLFTVAAGGFTNLSDRILTNIGEMENTGVELTLNAVVIDRKNLDWNVGFNVSNNKNEITKLDNSNLPEFAGYETGGISGDIGQTIQILKVGEAVGTFRAYQHIIKPDGTPVSDTEDFNGDGIATPLDMYRDVDGDGTINERDLVLGENSAPDILMGFSSSVNYKNFDLAFTLRSSFGNYVYNNVASTTAYFDRLTDRVTNNIDETAFETNFKTKQLKSDYYIEDASFLKMDNISLGYSFTNVSFMDQLRLYATVQNVFTLTGYTGLDPELPQFNNGIDNNIYPVSRTFLVGINASF
jgi:iron complex outermembrane receptor protein